MEEKVCAELRVLSCQNKRYKRLLHVSDKFTVYMYNKRQIHSVRQLLDVYIHWPRL